MIWIKKLILPILTIASSYLILTYVSATPFFYLALLFTMVFLVAARLAPTTGSKAVYWNLALLLLLFAVSEAYFAGWNVLGMNPTSQESTKAKILTTGPYAYKEITGYSSSIKATSEEKKYYGGKLIYNVTYKTNQYGLRIAPHDINPPHDSHYKNVFFFGCSFTFGTGVQNSETLPYLFEAASGGRYRAYNFGMGGYGPHQMLRILETGLIDRVIDDKKPAIAVYSALMVHIDRAAGKYNYFLWDVAGPKYQLDANGKIRYVGRFNDTLSAKIKYKVLRGLSRSYLLEAYGIARTAGGLRTQEDIDTFIQIIVRSSQLFAEKYQGEFCIILRGEDKDKEYVRRELANNKVKVFLIEDIIKDFKDDSSKYTIPHDGHPNQLYNQKIATFLLDYLEKDHS